MILYLSQRKKHITKKQSMVLWQRSTDYAMMDNMHTGKYNAEVQNKQGHAGYLFNLLKIKLLSVSTMHSFGI